jgi:hypothetical protein
VGEHGWQDDRNGLPDTLSGMAFLVRVDRSSFERNSNGLITGVLFVELDGVAFPDARWNDFVVVVLSWWLEALAPLRGGALPRVCLFMDGPFQFEVQPDAGDTCRVKLVDGRRTASVVERQVPMRDIVDAVIGAARQVLDYCESSGWASPDIDTLDAHYSYLTASRA